MTTTTGMATDWPSSRVAWTTIAVLMLAYILSFVDRMIFGLLIGPIRADFAINDTIFSLLYGWGFAFFYTLLGIPLGRAADHLNRRNLAAAGVALWSAMTVICGLSRTFIELALARIAVGVGEASLSPAAYSMAGDSFPPHRLGKALSVFIIGWPLGIGLALVIGGIVIQSVTAEPLVALPLIGDVKSWQACFIVVGAPGLLISLMVLALPEPARRKSGDGHRASLRQAVGHLVTYWRPYASLTFGYSMLSIVMNTYQLWGVQYFVRNLGFDTGRAGLWIGMVIATFGTLGVLVGGWLHDRLRAAGYSDAALRVGVIAGVAMLPSAAASTLMTDPLLAIALMIPIGFFTSFGFGASGAAIVLITPPSMRGTASAVYLFFLNVIAMGMGPLLTARLNDAVFHSDQAVGKSVAIVATTALLVAAGLFAWGMPHLREMHQRAISVPGGLSTT